MVGASAGAVLYLGLGAWVGTLTPRPRRASLLAAFLVLLGLAFAPAALLSLLAAGDPSGPLLWALRSPAAAAAWAAALGLACAAPSPLEDRRLLWTALGIGFGLALAGAGLAVAAGGLAGLAAGPAGGAPSGGAPLWVLAAGHTLGSGFLYAAGVLLALRAQPARGADPGEVRGLGLLAVALALPVAVPAGTGVPEAGGALARGEVVGTLAAAAGPLAWLAVAGLWERNMTAAGEDAARTHRLAFHGILASLAVGALYGAAAPGGLPGFSSLHGLAVVASAGLLGYGVHRHGLAGVDVAVRWGPSRATAARVAAAAFVAVGLGAFLLSADAGAGASLQLGLLAACGALAAWWLLDPAAGRVVDGGRGWEGAGAGPERRHRVMYEAMVRRFADDGGLSPQEEQALAKIARKLDLDPDRAEALRRGEGLEGTEPPLPEVRVAGPEPQAEAGSGTDAEGEAPPDGSAAALAGPASDGDGRVADGGDGAPGDEAPEGGTGPGPEPGDEGPTEASEEVPEPSSTGDPGGADGDRSEASASGDGSLGGRMDLRRNAETGEVEMVIHETPWGEVRVDLGEAPDGG